MNLATEFVREFYLKRKRKNPALSIRSFAKKVGIAPGALSEILAEKRALTRKSAVQIANNLNLSLTERTRLLGYFERGLSQRIALKNSQYQELDEDEFKSIADWEHYALYTLIDTDDFRYDVPWIAKRLGISVVEVRAAIRRLERLGLVKVQENSLERIAPRIATTTDKLSPALRLSHKQALHQAIDALEDVAIDLRDITSVTFSTDPKRLAEAKLLIKDFRRSFSKLMETGEKKEVYQLQVCLIPLTKGDVL